MPRTSLIRKHDAKDAVMQIAEEDRFSDTERQALLEVLEGNPNAQRTIIRLSSQAVAMREKTRDIDRQIKQKTEELHASDAWKELKRLKGFRRSCIDYQAECEAQERGVWASLLSGMKKTSKLYRKMLGAAGVLGGVES